MCKEYMIVEKPIDDLSSKELDMVYDFLYEKEKDKLDEILQWSYADTYEQDFIDALEFFLKTTGMRLVNTYGYNLSDVYYQFDVDYSGEDYFIENHLDYTGPVSNGVWIGEDFETVWAPYRTKMIEVWKKVVDAYNAEPDRDWENDPTIFLTNWIYDIDNDQENPIVLWKNYVSETVDEVHDKFARDIDSFLSDEDQVKEYMIDILCANYGNSVVYFRKDFVNGEEVLEVFDTDIM